MKINASEAKDYLQLEQLSTQERRNENVAKLENSLMASTYKYFDKNKMYSYQEYNTINWSQLETEYTIGDPLDL